MTPDPFRYQLFVSYARKDNQPIPSDGGEGWVSAFVRELAARHRRYSAVPLRLFFDTEAIGAGVDWKERLGQGLRQSRLLLAFLSPNYITSKNCLWEWEEYLLREHGAALGNDGVTPVFFVEPRVLRTEDREDIAAWLDRMEAAYPWFRRDPGTLAGDAERLARALSQDLSRRNTTEAMRYGAPLYPGYAVELSPWFQQGPALLRELDAAARSAAVTAAARTAGPASDPGSDPGSDPVRARRTLAEHLEGLGRHIAARLGRIALARLAPGNVPAGHEHFVGRHRELRQLHDLMLGGGPAANPRGGGGCGMIAAAHSPGGLGKTALARQYAHAYAEHYAAGGTWEIGCEGLERLGAALLRLAEDGWFQGMCAEAGLPLRLSEAQRADYALAAGTVLAHLKRVTEARVDLLRRQLAQEPDQTPDGTQNGMQAWPELAQPRALLILDNVESPALLTAEEASRLPHADWLEIIVTTRLDPDRFGSGERWQRAVEITPLPPADALELIRDFQPGHRFADAAQEDAARAIVADLAGYTLAVELVAAYLGAYAADLVPAQYLERLHQGGGDPLDQVDPLADWAGVPGQIRHPQKRVGAVLDWSLARLSPPARTALHFAALLQTDRIPLAWLEILTRARHAEDLSDEPGHPPAWPRVWRELYGLRLLQPADPLPPDARGLVPVPGAVRLHRLVAAHLAAADPDGGRTWQELDAFLDALTDIFEAQVGQGDDDWLRDQHPWLRDQLTHLIAPAGPGCGARPPTASLLRSAGVAADFEGEHGALAKALAMTGRVLAAQEDLLAANPDSAQAARDVSVSLERLGDFLSARGQPGDADQALAHYRRDLEISERLLAANPDSA